MAIRTCVVRAPLLFGKAGCGSANDSAPPTLSMQLACEGLGKGLKLAVHNAKVPDRPALPQFVLLQLHHPCGQLTQHLRIVKFKMNPVYLKTGRAIWAFEHFIKNGVRGKILQLQLVYLPHFRTCHICATYKIAAYDYSRICRARNERTNLITTAGY